MKKIIFLSLLAIGMTGCSVESMDSEELLTADASAKLTGITSVDYDEVVCFGNEGNFTFNFPQAYNKNDKEQKTLVKLELWNEESGEWKEIHQGNYDGEGPKYFSYDFGAIGTYLLQYRIGTGDNWTSISVSVVDCNLCENALVAELVCGETNTVTFTFTAEEAGPIVIQGGLNNWAEIIDAVGVGVAQTVKPGAPGSASVTRWEGDIDACEVVTITIEFTGGNGIGDWSAKRGEEVLGETVVQTCNND
ncbi:MAG: hypothetical protein ACQEWG_03785 [Bacteroidota bacterium]